MRLRVVNKMHFQSRFFNVIYIGICFMVLLTAFQTLENLQKVLINSIKDENPEYGGDGYLSLMLLFGTAAASTWLAPSVISMLGPVTSLVLASIGFVIYITAFLIENAWTVYLGCIIQGGAGAILWAAQGNYIVINSNPDTVSRNTGIFWMIFQSSALYGNCFVYFVFAHKTHIDRPTRVIVISVLLAVALLACLMMVFLRSPKVTEFTKESNDGPITALNRSWAIFTTRKMVLLSITSCFLGLQSIYVLGVYSSCLGFTLKFGNVVKQLVVLSGICIGIGEIVGGLLLIIVLEPLKKTGRDRSLMFSTGVILQSVSFGLMIINLPSNSVFGDTNDEAFIQSSVIIGLLCSFLLGVGDSIYNTQLISLLAVLYPGESSKTIPLSNFTKSSFCSIGFLTSNLIGLHTQVSIIFVLGLVGLVIFCIIDSGVNSKTFYETSRQQPSEILQNIKRSEISTIS